MHILRYLIIKKKKKERATIKLFLCHLLSDYSKKKINLVCKLEKKIPSAFSL